MADTAPWIRSFETRHAPPVSLAGLSGEELRSLSDPRAFGGFRYAATDHFVSLAAHARDPIGLQVIPDPLEETRSVHERDDALGEEGHRVSPRVVRQYRSRVLVRANADCFVHCRFCYRRALKTEERGFITDAEIESLTRYLDREPDVREVLVSGGDPLAASDDKVVGLLSSLRRANGSLVIRVCTRAPVALPSRFTPSLLADMARMKPISVVMHVNHPAELHRDAVLAVESCIASGIPVFSQTVLLRGVNDDVDTLERLFSSLWRLSVIPYYLFQGDLAPGTSRFRIPLRRGLSLYSSLRSRLSGIECPRYAVDIPGGRGKALLPEDIASLDEGVARLSAPGGREGTYPLE